MNDVQRNKLMMINKVIEFFQEHGPVLFPLNPGLEDDVDALIALRDAILDDDTEATQDTTGIAEDKVIDRTDVVRTSKRVGKALVAYYMQTNNRTLKNRYKINDSAWDTYNDAEVLKMSGLIKKGGATVGAAALAPFNGFLPADLTAQSDAHDAFLDIVALPTEKRSEKVSYGILVDRHYEEADKLLQDTIDDKMELHEETHPQEYLEYKGARGIDDTGNSGGSSSIINYSGTLAANSVNSPGTIGTYAPDVNIQLKATGTVAITFGLLNGAAPAGSTITVPAGGTLNVVLSAFGATSATAIFVKNDSPDTAGTYAIKIGF